MARSQYGHDQHKCWEDASDATDFAVNTEKNLKTNCLARQFGTNMQINGYLGRGTC